MQKTLKIKNKIFGKTIIETEVRIKGDNKKEYTENLEKYKKAILLLTHFNQLNEQNKMLFFIQILDGKIKKQLNFIRMFCELKVEEIEEKEDRKTKEKTEAEDIVEAFERLANLQKILKNNF